jgi:hypothetical protein
MTRKILLFLAIVLATMPAYRSEAQTNAASVQSQIPKTKSTKITLRVRKIPQGSVAKVVLRDKTKLEGRLGEVSAESFRLQTFNGEQIQDQTIAFEDVKKVSVSRLPWGRGNREAVPLVAGTAVGTVALTVIILVAVGAL